MDRDECLKEDCYKYGFCWACVKWFGCENTVKQPNCFKCDKDQCPKEKK